MERAAKTMKLIPIASELYTHVLQELEQLEDHPTEKIPLYTPEQKSHILRYLINFLEAERGEIQKQID